MTIPSSAHVVLVLLLLCFVFLFVSAHWRKGGRLQ
jgi:hypothetical protein